MTMNFAVSPFGDAPLKLALFSLNQQVQAARGAIRDGHDQPRNDGGAFDKWKLINALGQARTHFGLSDRTVAVLNALLSVLPGREITLGEEQIVFPSNAELSRRTNGMADATLRRHISALVGAGLLLRRDSPNGKRYARRDDAGQIEAAFGFDLGPLALRAPEIFAQEEAVKREQLQMRKLRDEISVHIRDSVKILDAALAEGRTDGDWQGFGLKLAALGKRLRRGTPIETLIERRDRLMELRILVEKAWLSGLSEHDMSANDTYFERQLQNSNTESHFCNGFEKTMKQSCEPEASNSVEIRTGPTHALAPERKGGAAPIETQSAESENLPALSSVLSACPQIVGYAKNGINTWRDLSVTANLVRSMLGISPDAWGQAERALGVSRAAIVMAAMLERADKIRVPGGYLRAITLKAQNSGFSVVPMLDALLARPRSS